MRFKKKVVLVTGGSRGIGRGIAEAFAREGARVVINFSPEADSGPFEGASQIAAAAIRDRGGEVETFPSDVSKSADVQAMVKFVLERFGPVDILANNAGISPFANFLELTEEIWDRVFDVNIKGAFLCSQAVARLMVERGIKGRIVCTSSIGAIAGTAFQSHYCATKAGINLFVKSIATALGPHGITVNAVMPGLILTDINRQFLVDNPQVEKDYMQKIPVGRVGTPEDIAEAVLFLASDQASYINGSTLIVDGGFMAHV